MTGTLQFIGCCQAHTACSTLLCMVGMIMVLTMTVTMSVMVTLMTVVVMNRSA